MCWFRFLPLTLNPKSWPAFETTSLTNKFKSLWLAGIEAKLTFETHAGQAWGTLQVCLGENPRQVQEKQLHSDLQETPQRHESPSKHRRRERREAAWAAAALAARSEPIAEEVIGKEANENEDGAIQPLNTEEVEEIGDASANNDGAEEASGDQGSLFITDVDDEISDDENYFKITNWDEIVTSRIEEPTSRCKYFVSRLTISRYLELFRSNKLYQNPWFHTNSSVNLGPTVCKIFTPANKRMLGTNSKLIFWTFKSINIG